jgi:heptose I phosphotransferase
MRMPGEVAREHKNRRTICTEINGREYFIKTHGRTSWREILKNATRGRWPVLTSEPELNAIKRFEELGIPTTHAVGFGWRGRFPDRLESFLITESLNNPSRAMMHLSDVPAQLQSLASPQRTPIIRAMILEVARLVRVMHMHGLNHRDLYLCHFMLRQRDWSTWHARDGLDLHIIDLHRVQIRSRTPRRWVIKDLSGLLFSALDAGLTQRDLIRFLHEYWRAPWRERLLETRRWRRTIVRRAVSLYQAEHGKPPPQPAGRASFA